MWTKDIYQEQILGYLGEVETEIEQLMHSPLHPHDLKELYIDLDIVTKRLWRLIGASDVDWESFRSPLETSCDRLQQDFYRVPRAGALVLTADAVITEQRRSRAVWWETAQMLRYGIADHEV